MSDNPIPQSEEVQAHGRRRAGWLRLFLTRNLPTGAGPLTKDQLERAREPVEDRYYLWDEGW